MKSTTHSFRLKYFEIDTYKDPVIYLHKGSELSRSEGSGSPVRIQVTLNDKTILATINIVGDDILSTSEAGLSRYAWYLLGGKQGDIVQLSHPKPLESLSALRSKIYGNTLSGKEIDSIIRDITFGRYSDIYVSSFITATATTRMNLDEITYLTKSMIDAGKIINWEKDIIVDKHSIGGIPGNRTTLIIVPIISAFGLTMPKTSSRAITSPAGTADTMEVLAPVNLTLTEMQRVVDKEFGCIVWGGSVELSPADDIIIKVERALELDSESQLVASILSKKIAAGSTHVLIDFPVGPTAKVRSTQKAKVLAQYLTSVSERLGIALKILFTEGVQPVGRGIGPALEARDVLAVLQNHADAPTDLKDKSIMLAGSILEFSGKVKVGMGNKVASDILTRGDAWKKFQAICEVQGGMRSLPKAKLHHTIVAPHAGIVTIIQNRSLARIARLAGAPTDKAAGIDFHSPLLTKIVKGQPLFTIYSETQSQLEYALSYFEMNSNVITIEELP